MISLQLAWYLFVLFLFSQETMFIWLFRGRRGRIVVGFTTTCASCEFDSRSWRGVFDTTWCDAVCQWHATGRWISLGTLVSPTNKTHRHDITEILLKVPLSTITLTIYGYSCLVIDLYTFNQIPIRENRKGNQEWTIKRHLQHWGKDKDKHNTTQKTLTLIYTYSHVRKVLYVK